MSVTTDCDIDVVIVNYNAGNYITDMVLALKKSDCLNIQVVDNNSKDGSTEALLALNAAVIENKENTGYAAACNQGAAVAHAPLIAFVNPDCVLDAVQLKQLAECAQVDGVGLVGCQVVNVDGSIQRGTWRRLPTLWRVLLTASGIEQLMGFQGLNLKAAPKNAEALNGACFVVKREVFESVNGFDDQYPLHFEDLDLFKRIQDAGHKILYAKDVKIKHVKGHSSTDSRQVQSWKKVGMLRYFKKHRPAWEGSVIRLLVGLK